MCTWLCWGWAKIRFPPIENYSKWMKQRRLLFPVDTAQSYCEMAHVSSTRHSALTPSNLWVYRGDVYTLMNIRPVIFFHFFFYFRLKWAKFRCQSQVNGWTFIVLSTQVTCWAYNQFFWNILYIKIHTISFHIIVCTWKHPWLTLRGSPATKMCIAVITIYVPFSFYGSNYPRE